MQQKDTNQIKIIDQKDVIEQFFSLNLDLLCIMDLEGRLIKLSHSFETVLGYDLNLLSHFKFLDIVHKDDVEATKQMLQLLYEGLEINHFINRCRTAEGAYRYIEWKGSRHNDWLYMSARDTTDKRRVEQQLNEERELFKTTLLSVADGVIATDNAGFITVMNKVAESLTGWTQQEALGQPILNIFHVQDEESHLPIEWTNYAIINAKSLDQMHEVMMVNRSGIHIPIEASIAPIQDRFGSVTGRVTVFRDYTEKKARQQEIEYLSFHDAMTGLYNRRYMEDAIKRLDTKRNLPFTVMALDLNGLKMTNDAFGHEVGDQLLLAATKSIQAVCRVEDIICRVGGDEFMILLPQVDELEAEQLKKRIKNSVKIMPIEHVVLSLAIGFAVKTSHFQRIEDILKEADSHMYEDKLKHGKKFRNQTIEMLLDSVAQNYTHEADHIIQVSIYAAGMMTALGASQRDIEKARLAGKVHDIGKVMIDPDILNKKGQLTEEEWVVIKQHPITGYNILKGVDEYTSVALEVLHHHEYWDGSGYPDGLKRETIPLVSRIIAVADAFDALLEQQKNIEEALRAIECDAGKRYDPAVVRALQQYAETITRSH